MKHLKKTNVAKESAVHVLAGLITNYPLSLFCIWLCIDVLEMTNTFYIGTTTTAIITVVAYVRVYLIRSRYENQRVN
jgi:hypothetical protein